MGRGLMILLIKFKSLITWKVPIQSFSSERVSPLSACCQIIPTKKNFFSPRASGNISKYCYLVFRSLQVPAVEYFLSGKNREDCMDSDDYLESSNLLCILLQAKCVDGHTGCEEPPRDMSFMLSNLSLTLKCDFLFA